MIRTTTSKTFQEYWEDTESNRAGYPEELKTLLKRHELTAWISAVQSAANNTHFAIQKEMNKAPTLHTVVHDTIWAMKYASLLTLVDEEQEKERSSKCSRKAI